MVLYPRSLPKSYHFITIRMQPIELMRIEDIKQQETKAQKFGQLLKLLDF